jgi:adenosylmethionine-8-amino-7-oxononanoate aminotransferase
MHGPTYMANALACAAANASLDLFERENRLKAACDIAAGLTRRLDPCLGMKAVRDVRVRGAIGVVELDQITDLNDLKRRFVDESIWVRPFSNIVYLTPALTIDDADLNTLAGAVRRVLGRET